MATVVRLDFILNWHDSIQIPLEVSLSLKRFIPLEVSLSLKRFILGLFERVL